MLSSPFDIFGALDRVLESVDPLGYGGIASGVAVAAAAGIGIKVLKAATSGSGSVSKGSAPSVGKPSDSQNADAKSDARGVEENPEKQQEQQKQRDEEKRKEDELRRSQEKLSELFELFENDRKEDEQEKREEKERDELGDERPDLEKLKEQYKELVAEIASLIEKGMTAEQTAKELISRTTEQISAMEYRPLIETMMFFLQKQEKGGKNTAVIGVDPQFEQRAALSALKRGDQEVALDYLERRAAEELKEASSSRRNDVCCPAMEQAASLYRAIGVLTRPTDPERSFEALKKSAGIEPENTETQALIARAYYESGRKEKAEQTFENIAGNGRGKDYVVHYAAQKSCEIKTDRVMQHAVRIREEYENRLSDVEGRQKTDALSLQKQKRAEVMRANNRFIADELHDRDNEHVRI